MCLSQQLVSIQPDVNTFSSSVTTFSRPLTILCSGQLSLLPLAEREMISSSRARVKV